MIASAAGAARIVPVPGIPVESVFEKILIFILTFNGSQYVGWVHELSYWLQIFSTFFSLLCIVAIILITIKWSEFHRAQHEKEEAARAASEVKPDAVEASPVQIKWQRVLTHLESANPNDWRLAILEADIMLDDLLTDRGYPGETLGEKLKGIDRNSFTLLDSAWEAHRIRNLIAHEGADFTLPQREASRVISLYQAVFRYSNYI